MSDRFFVGYLSCCMGTGEGTSLLYIGALVLECAMMGGAGKLAGAKAVVCFRGRSDGLGCFWLH